MGPRNVARPGSCTPEVARPGSCAPEVARPGSCAPEVARPVSCAPEEQQDLLVDVPSFPPDTVTDSHHVTVNICQSAEPMEAVCCEGGIRVFQHVRLLREHWNKAVFLAVVFVVLAVVFLAVVFLALLPRLYFGSSSNKDGEQLTASAFPFLNPSSTLSGWETCGNLSYWRSPGKAGFNGSRDSCAQNNGRLFNDSDLQVLNTCYEIPTDTWIDRMDTDKCSIYDGNGFYGLACDSERHFICVREI